MPTGIPYKTDEERKKAVKKQKRKAYLKNREKILKQKKEYREKNKERISAWGKKYYLENSKEIKRKVKKRKKEKGKEYYNNSIEKIREYTKEYYSRPEVKKRQAEYYQKNKKKLRKKRNERSKKRYKNDLNFYLVEKLRSRIRRSVSRANVSKSNKLNELVGCSIYDLKKYLEKKFKKGMTWENRKSWHIDHIIPISYFVENYNFENEYVQKICFHYSNLQPLWKIDNEIKHDKVDSKKIRKIKKLLKNYKINQ